MNKHIFLLIIFIISINVVLAYDGDLCNSTHTPCSAGIDGLCTSTDLSTMYYGARDFNNTIGDITQWNTSCITNMNGMFGEALFNQDIGNWDVSHVVDMNSMFYLDNIFNQDLSKWNFSSVNYIQDVQYPFQQFLTNVTLSIDNYDKLLNSLASQLNSYQEFDGGNSMYSINGKVAHDKLVNEYAWTVFDGGIYVNSDTNNNDNTINDSFNNVTTIMTSLFSIAILLALIVLLFNIDSVILEKYMSIIIFMLIVLLLLGILLIYFIAK